jgi:hypothetical protein
MQTLHDIGSSHAFCLNPYDLCLKLADIVSLDYTPRKGLSDRNNLFVKKSRQEKLWVELCSVAINLRMLDDEHKVINECKRFKRLRLKGFKCGKIVYKRNQQIPIKLAVEKGLFSENISVNERKRISFELKKGFIKNRKTKAELDLRVACNKIIHSTGFKIRKNTIIVEGEEQIVHNNKYFFEETIAEINLTKFVNAAIDFLCYPS